MKIMGSIYIFLSFFICFSRISGVYLSQIHDEPQHLESANHVEFQTGLNDCIIGNACSGTPLTVTHEGTICMPVFGGQYDKDMNCQWRISAPIGHVIKFEYNAMDIESCQDCACDFASLHDGPDINSSLLDKLCGSEEKIYYSKYQNLFLRFFSDHTINAAGFKADITFIPVPRVAFHAVRMNPQDATLLPVQLEFEATTVDEGANFDLEKNQFMCAIPGPYYFSICAGVATRKEVNMILRLNGSRYVSALRTSSNHDNIDMISRSVIIELQEGDIIDVEIGSYTAVYSDGAMQTSLTGFLLPFVNENTAAVFAAKANNDSSSGYVSNIEKKILEINDWRSNNQYFYNPYVGIYYAEMSVCQSEKQHFRLYLRTSIRLGGYSGSHGEGAIDTTSHGCLESMGSSDYWRLYAGETFSNNELQTSILSFSIASDERRRPHFRADSTSSLSSPGPITFTNLVLDDEVEFDLDSGTFTCLIPGTYFVRVAVGTAFTDEVSHEADVNILKNDQSISGLVRMVTSQPSVALLSRSLLVNMAEGDILRLHLMNGQLYSHSYVHTTFSSFLLFESTEFLKTQELNDTLVPDTTQEKH